MSRTYSSPGLKPRIWNPSVGLIAPEWRWVWEDAVLLYPFWEGGGGTVRDVIRGDELVNNQGGGSDTRFVESKIGPSYSFADANIDDHISSTTAPRALNGLTELTTVVSVKSNKTSSDAGIYQGEDESTDSDGSGLWMRYDAAGFAGGESNVIKVSFGDTNGETSSLESSANTQTTDRQHLVVSWRVGEVPRLWIDGVEDTPSFTSSGSDPININELLVGLAGGARGRWDGLVDYALFLNTTVTDAQAKQLARDPFGPFRMERRTALLVPTDTTAPTLTNAAADPTSETTADGSVDTDEGNGTLYWIVDQNQTAPSVAQIQAGQGSDGAAADASGNQAVSATGTQNVSATGLSPGTEYWFHFQHTDDADNDSSVVTSGSFWTHPDDVPFFLSEAASGEIRDSHYVTDEAGGTKRATRLETSRTNSYTRSEDLDHGDWTKSNVSVSADATGAPDGATTMDRTTEDDTAAGTEHAVEQALPAVADDGDQVVSFWGQPDGREWLAIRTTDQGGATRTSWVNVSTGAIGTSDPEHTVREVEVDHLVGSRRFAVTFNASSGATTPTVEYLLADADGSLAYEGDGTSGLYLWGVQIEARTFPGSYISTTDTSVTRPEEEAIDTISFDPQALTLWVKARSLLPDSQERALPHTRLFHVGTDTGPAFFLNIDGNAAAELRVRDDSETVEARESLGMLYDYHQLYEVLCRLHSDGSVTFERYLDGSSTQDANSGASSGALSAGLPSSWGVDSLHIAHRPNVTNNAHGADILGLRVSSGDGQTITQMRQSGSGDLYSYAPGDAIDSFSRDKVATYRDWIRNTRSLIATDRGIQISTRSADKARP